MNNSSYACMKAKKISREIAYKMLLQIGFPHIVSIH